LAELQRILESPGYSRRLREAKRREAEMIRERLEQGDLRVGDQIALFVEGQQQLTDTFTVVTGRMLVLPNLPDIPVGGVLRSELGDHLSRELAKYLRNPIVRAQSLIRLSFVGSITRPGFYNLPADMLVSDAIMASGGPAGGSDPNRSQVRRLGEVILTREDFQSALVEGVTLDQMNLRAGDEIVVDPNAGQGGTGAWGRIGLFTSLLGSMVFVITRVF
jgi:protein involved in polysaccharide export with SLBB domain